MIEITGGKEKGTIGHGFSAWRNSAQSIPTGVATVILFNTELFDSDNDYDASIGKYTPQVEGYYTVHSNVVIEALGNAIRYIVRLEKNDVVVGIDRGVSGGIDACGGCASCVIYMNGSTDFLDVKFFHAHGAARNTSATQGHTSFSAWLLPAPP